VCQQLYTAAKRCPGPRMKAVLSVMKLVMFDVPTTNRKSPKRIGVGGLVAGLMCRSCPC